MGFGDLKSQAGLKALNDFLADKSYIEGYVPSQGDAVVFAALAGAPDSKNTHALRWYSHIKSYGNDSAKFSGVKKPVTAYGPAGGAAAAADDDDDDDDIDLFGSDDDEAAAEAAKLKQERIDAYAAKKSKMETAKVNAVPAKPAAPAQPAKTADEGDDDDFDLFGSDDDETAAEAEKAKQERIADYAAKKAKKPALIAKSSIILDVKPWDDETDMKKMEEMVRTIEADGLVWGAAKLVPLAYGIKKLQIICVVEDDKIGTDFLEEKITDFEDFVQSVDIAAFNKI